MFKETILYTENTRLGNTNPNKSVGEIICPRKGKQFLFYIDIYHNMVFKNFIKSKLDKQQLWM